VHQEPERFDGCTWATAAVDATQGATLTLPGANGRYMPVMIVIEADAKMPKAEVRHTIRRGDREKGCHRG
jgi:hypothetical protein